MTPDFVKAVDPIIEMMVNLKEKIDRNNAPPATHARDAFIRQFEASAKFLHHRQEEWDVARYALVAWIDEQLASVLSWTGSSYWNQNKLQVNYYGHQLARERFYVWATKAEQMPKKDALEVYFLCVVLGFEGAYDNAPGLQTPTDLGLPETKPDWIRKVRNWIKLTPVKLSERRTVGVEHDAEPLTGRVQVLSMVVTTIVTAAIVGMAVYIHYCIRKDNGEDSAAVLPRIQSVVTAAGLSDQQSSNHFRS